MLRLGQAPKDLIGHWKEGVSLERDSGSTIEQLCLAVAAGRWLLAYDFRRHGNALLTRTPPLFRSVISRYYPRWTPQNRPYVDRANPAKGVSAQGRMCCSAFPPGEQAA